MCVYISKSYRLDETMVYANLSHSLKKISGMVHAFRAGNFLSFGLIFPLLIVGIVVLVQVLVLA